MESELTKTEWPPKNRMAAASGLSTQGISPLPVVSLSGSTYARKTEGVLFLDMVHLGITYVVRWVSFLVIAYQVGEVIEDITHEVVGTFKGLPYSIRHVRSSVDDGSKTIFQIWSDRGRIVNRMTH